MKSLGNVFILGDSYSTYEGYIPEGYAVYYEKNGNPDEGKVSRVENTWWHRLITETNSRLIMNNSWSGSTVCKTGYNGEFCEESSFVTRIKKYIKDGKCNGENVDTVIVFGATNDCWAGSPLGEKKFDGYIEDDFKCFLPSYCCVFKYLKEQNSTVRTIAIINSNLSEEITKKSIEILNELEIEYVALKDIDKINGHPTEKGMEQIKEQILDII